MFSEIMVRQFLGATITNYKAKSKYWVQVSQSASKFNLLSQEDLFQPVITADFRFYDCSIVLGLINQELTGSEKYQNSGYGKVT